MNAVPPAPEELDALLRLIDDETPEVRDRVRERFAHSGGDISEWLATWPGTLSHHETELLIEMLRPPRREALAREWIAPTGGAIALQEDWETFEAMLQSLSDFLHDGISLRQPLSDALDLLAEEATEEGVTCSDELRSYLFASGRLTGSRESDNEPHHSDLAWCIAEGKSNPLGLGLIFMLTARRLDFEVEGVNFPGHFMCRIFEEGHPWIVDCFEKGRSHLQSTLLESVDLTRSQRALLKQSADPGTLLVRLLNNLHNALEHAEREADVQLIGKLRETLE